MTTYEAAKNFRNNEDLIGKTVQIKRSNKTAYMKLIGMHGIVDRISGGTTIGVRIDDMNNEASAYGVFWFSRNEIKILDEDRKDITKMDFKHVAMVRLFDYSKKEYAFALYDEELTKLQNEGNWTKLMVMQEEMKTLPFGDVWAKYCEECGVPANHAWYAEVKKYEEEVLLKR